MIGLATSMAVCGGTEPGLRGAHGPEAAHNKNPKISEASQTNPKTFELRTGVLAPGSQVDPGTSYVKKLTARLRLPLADVLIMAGGAVRASMGPARRRRGRRSTPVQAIDKKLCSVKAAPG